MRGRRRTVASVLAETLSARRGAELPALAAAFAEALGPRLSREASMRGLSREGRLLVLVRSPDWGGQIQQLEREICERVNARLGRPVAFGLDVRVAPEAKR
jgi:hypothetical protein